jgi:lysophospholipase L1-like esterase
MKKILYLLLIIVIWSQFMFSQIKIACVGNSITYGAGIIDRERNSYPAQLQFLLGDKYEVKNFGLNGATLLKNGNKPYFKTEEYKNALAFNPDIVFIKLGTNDTKYPNRTHFNEFKNDYFELISSFRNLKSNPRVIILLPLPVYFEPDSVNINGNIIRDTLLPMIRQIAYESKTEIINLYNLFLESSFFFPDKLHPSSIGASYIAQRCYEAVKMNIDKDFDLISNLKIEGKKSNYYGFELTDFKFNDWDCKIAQPRKAAAGHPYIWRARFWGHEPQTEIALLERGFHVVFCDISELYGSSKAIDRWNKFYAFLLKGGLSSKAVLEGFSRGGLNIYNWAVENPEKVACIYADAPVLDIKSWPYRFGRSQTPAREWIALKKAFGFNSDEEAEKAKVSPIDKTDKIVKTKIPLLHVCGLADKIVPYDENTKPFAEKIIKAGGSIKVIEKPGVDHHPHSLANPQPILNFILKNTGYKTNFAILPKPGIEYRSVSAGWKENTNWFDEFEDINFICTNNEPLDILFIGNSITQRIGGNRNLSYAPGKNVFDKAFKGYKYECAGISGDRTQNILWRIENGKYGSTDPKFVVLTLGVNNFGDDLPEEITDGISKCVESITRKMPKSKILLFGPLPAGKDSSIYRDQYIKVHQYLKKIKWAKNVVYFNAGNLFIDKKMNLNSGISKDGVHLTEEGYKIWAAAIKKKLNLKK